jgi:hypothetical protein
MADRPQETKVEVPTTTLLGKELPKWKAGTTLIGPSADGQTIVSFTDHDGIGHEMNQLLRGVVKLAELEALFLNNVQSLVEKLDYYANVGVVLNCSATGQNGIWRKLSDFSAAPTVEYVKSILTAPEVEPGEPHWPIVRDGADVICVDIEGNWTEVECAAASANLVALNSAGKQKAVQFHFWRHAVGVADKIENEIKKDSTFKRVWPAGASTVEFPWLKANRGEYRSAYSYPSIKNYGNDSAAAADALANQEVDQVCAAEGIYLDRIAFEEGGGEAKAIFFDTPTNVLTDHSGSKANNRRVCLRMFMRAEILVTVLVHFAGLFVADFDVGTEEHTQGLQILAEVEALTLGTDDPSGGDGHVINISKMYFEDWTTFTPEVRFRLWSEAYHKSTLNLTIGDLKMEWLARVRDSNSRPMYAAESKVRFDAILKKIQASATKSNQMDELSQLVGNMGDGWLKERCRAAVEDDVVQEVAVAAEVAAASAV